MLKHQNESGPRMAIVLDASHCNKHRAKQGEPCWKIHADGGRVILSAACGPRITRAGFTAPISSEAMSDKPSGKTPGKPPYQRYKSTKQGRPRQKAPNTSARTKDNS